MELMSPYFERTIITADRLIRGQFYSFYYQEQYYIAVFLSSRHENQVLTFNAYTIDNKYCRISMMFAPEEIDRLSIYYRE